MELVDFTVFNTLESATDATGAPTTKVVTAMRVGSDLYRIDPAFARSLVQKVEEAERRNARVLGGN